MSRTRSASPIYHIISDVQSYLTFLRWNKAALLQVKPILVTPMSHRTRQDGQKSHQEKDQIWVEEEGQEGVESIANAMTLVRTLYRNSSAWRRNHDEPSYPVITYFPHLARTCQVEVFIVEMCHTVETHHNTWHSY